MTKPWTDDDTRALADGEAIADDEPSCDYMNWISHRAAAYIEALEARVAELAGPCSFCLETPGHGAAKPICDGCAQLATDQAKTSRGLVERIAEGRRIERERVVAWLRTFVVQWIGPAQLAIDVERGEHEKGSGE